MKLRRLRIQYTILESSREAELICTWQDHEIRLERTWRKYVIKMAATPSKEYIVEIHNVVNLPKSLAIKLSASVAAILAKSPLAKATEPVLDGLDFTIHCETDDGHTTEVALSNPSLSMPDIGHRFEKLVGSIAKDSQFQLHLKSFFAF